MSFFVRNLMTEAELEVFDLWLMYHYYELK